MKRLNYSDVVARLDEAGTDYAETLENGSMRVGLYRPQKLDPQTPHTQDELYIVQTGRGDFVCDGERARFEPGDVLFAAAGIEHRFEHFSGDFSAWVIFYGPEGGE